MKIAIYVCALCLTTTLAAPTNQEEILRALTKQFEIDIETRPEDGIVNGIRIRRNGETQGANLGENEDYNFPDIEIKKINDQTLSVNGIRLKRSDLSDVELEKDIQAEASEINDGETDRTRRSGAETILGFLGSKITEKLSALAGASSGHNSEPSHSYGPPVTQSYDDKSFDIWAFKKAILNTLLQAVKAIKGGVIALGGQLVKAKGHLIATAGNVVATKGEAISGFGRQIAKNALLHPPPTTHHTAPATAFANAAVDHIPDTGYPSAGYPQASYGAPSVQSSYSPSLSASYGPPQHGYNKRGATSQQFGVPQELPDNVQAGLLVLKPINSGSSHHQSYSKRGSFDPRGASSSPQGFVSRGSNDNDPEQSEIQPVVVQDIQHAQARSYYIRY